MKISRTVSYALDRVGRVSAKGNKVLCLWAVDREPVGPGVSGYWNKVTYSGRAVFLLFIPRVSAARPNVAWETYIFVGNLVWDVIGHKFCVVSGDRRTFGAIYCWDVMLLLFTMPMVGQYQLVSNMIRRMIMNGNKIVLVRISTWTIIPKLQEKERTNKRR